MELSRSSGIVDTCASLITGVESYPTRRTPKMFILLAHLKGTTKKIQIAPILLYAESSRNMHKTDEKSYKNQ